MFRPDSRGENIFMEGGTRPPLSKKSFPVCRVTAKKASREVGIFFFSVFNFSSTRMYQED